MWFPLVKGQTTKEAFSCMDQKEKEMFRQKEVLFISRFFATYRQAHTEAVPDFQNQNASHIFLNDTGGTNPLIVEKKKPCCLQVSFSFSFFYLILILIF